MSKITTIWTYQLNGVQTEFAVNFDYLSRKFVQVTLIGKDRKVLRMNVDYRFIGPKTIKTTKAWGLSDGYQYLEIRRVTSATDLIVDFSDGSILRAGDLTIANLQSMHIAEEARNLAGDALGVNDEGNLDARARRIVNLGNPVGRLDAVNKAYVDDAEDGAVQARDKALQYRNEAEGFRNEALSAKTTVESKIGYLDAKYDRAEELNTSATTNADKALKAVTSASESAKAAAESEKKAKVSETNAKASEDKAREIASSFDPQNLVPKQFPVANGVFNLKGNTVGLPSKAPAYLLSPQEGTPLTGQYSYGITADNNGCRVVSVDSSGIERGSAKFKLDTSSTVITEDAMTQAFTKFEGTMNEAIDAAKIPKKQWKLIWDQKTGDNQMITLPESIKGKYIRVIVGESKPEWNSAVIYVPEDLTGITYIWLFEYSSAYDKLMTEGRLDGITFKLSASWYHVWKIYVLDDVQDTLALTTYEEPKPAQGEEWVKVWQGSKGNPLDVEVSSFGFKDIRSHEVMVRFQKGTTNMKLHPTDLNVPAIGYDIFSSSRTTYYHIYAAALTETKIKVEAQDADTLKEVWILRPKTEKQWVKVATGPTVNQSELPAGALVQVKLANVYYTSFYMPLDDVTSTVRVTSYASDAYLNLAKTGDLYKFTGSGQSQPTSIWVYK